jgi:hypothetical protein
VRFLALIVTVSCVASGCRAYDRDLYAGLTDAGADTVAPGDDGMAVPDARGACPASPAVDPCTSIPALATAPVIDGVLECGLTASPLRIGGMVVEPGTMIPAGFGARIATGYRPDGLYVYLDVDDPTRTPPLPSDDSWCGDVAEIYVDSDARYPHSPMYDIPGTAHFLFSGPADDTHPGRRGSISYAGQMPIVPWPSTLFATFPRPGGYIAEAFIVAADLGLASWSLTPGRSIGFDISIDIGTTTRNADAGACGMYLGQVSLRLGHVGCGHPSCDVEAFCNPMLRP